MKLHHVLSLLLLASAVSASAALQFAVVRVKEIYIELPSTLTFQQQIKGERDAIMKDQRAENLRKAIGDLQALQAQLADKGNPLDEATNRRLARTYEIKRQEAQSLQQDFESYKAEQEKAINRRMIAGMRASFDRILEASRKIAAERGYQSVFDSSGGTNTGLPFIIFSRDSPDLTADVRAAVKAAEPVSTSSH